MKEKKTKRITIISLVVLVLAIVLFGLIYVFKIAKHYPDRIELEVENNFFGLTFSKKYAEEIGLDWRQAYLDILDELQVRQIRLPIYWDQIEKSSGKYDFSDYDFLLEEGQKRDVSFILNIGQRVARWPECHFPAWIDSSDDEVLSLETLAMLQATVEHFKKYPSVAYWQVENEPLLNSFGQCPRGNYDFLKQEIALVKSLDDRPIIVSATGELSFWTREIKAADIFGTTMYRVVHNPILGYIRYPYTSGSYRWKAKMLKIDPKDIMIIELQAEPWIQAENLNDQDEREYQKSFNLEQFKANAQFAIDTGFGRAYLWGVEWWYYQYQVMGRTQYWEFAKTLF